MKDIDGGEDGTVTGRTPTWAVWTARFMAAVIPLGSAFSTWRALNGYGTIPPERLPFVLGMTWSMSLLLIILFLSGIAEVQAGSERLTFKRVSGRGRQLSWDDVEKVISTQREGRKAVKVVTGTGREFRLTDHLSNFDLLVRHITDRSGTKLERSPDILLGDEVSSRSFYLYESNQFTLDCLYLVHIARPNIHFLRVGGQLFGADPGINSSDPTTYIYPELLGNYEGVNPGSEVALAKDRRNFRMLTSEIRSVRLRPRRSWRTGKAPNSGWVIIEPVEGRPRKFILLAQQDHDHVARILREAGTQVVIE
jgi:hypothetical protein